jgi:hypothetical protein
MIMAESPEAGLYRDAAHASALRPRMRTLISEHPPAGALRPFYQRAAELELSNRFCEILAAEGLLVPNWPAG